MFGTTPIRLIAEFAPDAVMLVVDSAKPAAYGGYFISQLVREVPGTAILVLTDGGDDPDALSACVGSWTDTLRMGDPEWWPGLPTKHESMYIGQGIQALEPFWPCLQRDNEEDSASEDSIE